MTAGPGPYHWELHPVPWVVVAVAAVVVAVDHRRAGAGAWPTRQRAAFAGACLVALVALTWPLADLAAHWSLVALVVQRLLLVLAVPPLVLLGLPDDVLARLTRPAPVDAVLDQVRRFRAAVVIVTVVGVGSMTVPLVEAQASSAVARGLIDLAVLGAGLVLWLPVIGRVPGIARLQPWMRFAYLVVQAVVPAFLSFLYIFARRPFYPAFAGSHRAVGLAPLADQQVSGFVSKLTMLAVLLTVGAVVLNRAHRGDTDAEDDQPLRWADVERHFERADRRQGRRPPPDAGTPPGPDVSPGPPEPPEPGTP